eukprot:2669093-Amphidinium_carterae.1
MPEHTLMNRKRQIQERSTNDVCYESQDKDEDPLGAWRTCRPQGATRHNIESKRIRTSLSAVLFDMVAELAIAER